MSLSSNQVIKDELEIYTKKQYMDYKAISWS